MRRRAIKAEGQASAIAALGLLAAGVAALASQRLCTSDGRAVLAATPVLHRASADDVVLVDSALGRDERDRGRILFAFRPLPALSSDAAPIDLGSFPFRSVYFVGDVETGPWIGERPLVKTQGLNSARFGEPERLLVALADLRGVAVVSGTANHSCTRSHHSGGVSCGPDAWFYVGPIMAPLGGTSRFCLWAHPPRDGAELQIPLRIEAALVAAAPILRVQLNFLDETRGEEARVPVALRLVAGDRSNTVRCTNRDGSCQVDLELGAAAPTVGVTVSTPNNARQLVCLTGGLHMRSAPGERP